MPSPTETQYSAAATITFVHEKDQNAAIACTWNHPNTRQVIRLSFEYRSLDATSRTLSMHAPREKAGMKSVSECEGRECQSSVIVRIYGDFLDFFGTNARKRRGLSTMMPRSTSSLAPAA